jgi:hypothetical protein
MGEEQVNALAELEKAVNNSLSIRDDKAFAALTKSSEYFPRLQLCTSSSNLCKEGKVGINEYAYIVSDDDFTVLGKELEIIPIAWRPKALDMSGAKPVSVYDEKSEAFNAIATKSDTKDSKCTFGPEFLVWIPKNKKFACLHMGSKTNRPESKNIRPHMMKGVTLKSYTIKTEKYTWQGINAFPCTTPLEGPDPKEALEVLNKFNKEVSDNVAAKVEVAATNDGAARR